MRYGNLKSEIDNSPVLPMFQSIQNNISSGDEFMQATVTLTNDQIITLPTSLVVLVPATETLGYSGVPTQLPLPIAAFARLNNSAGAYSGLDAGIKFILCWGEYDVNVMEADAVALDDPTPGRGYRFIPFRTNVSSESPTDPHSHSIVQFVSNLGLNGSFGDNSLRIYLSNGDNLADGNAANTLTVTVIYAVIDL